MNVIIYDKFITKFLKRRYSQYALVALVRSAMVLANQEFLLAFMVRRNNWRKKVAANIKNKTEVQKKKLLKMQKPTSEAIKEQVSEELDNQLPDQVSGLVVESALKISSKRKRRAAAKKKNRSKQGTTQQTIAQETDFVEKCQVLRKRVKFGSLYRQLESPKPILRTKHLQEDVLMWEHSVEEGKREGEVDDLFQDTPVRMIHMICLLLQCSSTRTKCYR